MVNYFIYAVAALLLISVGLYVKAALFGRRPQKTGLIMALLALPLYMIYYNDRWPSAFGQLRMREAVSPLKQIQGADVNFTSDIAPALIICAVLLVHMTVFQRVAVRERLQRIHDPDRELLRRHHVHHADRRDDRVHIPLGLGRRGRRRRHIRADLSRGGRAAGRPLRVFVALVQYFAVWIKRKVFALATRITRASSWIFSLAGRLGLTSFADRIRADTMQQESRFLAEQEEQDRKLIEAYVRDRARRRRMGAALDPEPAEPTPASPLAAAPAPAAAVVAGAVEAVRSRRPPDRHDRLAHHDGHRVAFRARTDVPGRKVSCAAWLPARRSWRSTSWT